ALGTAARACKQPKLAEKYFASAGTFPARIALGDLAAARNDWKEAAKQYLGAYKESLKTAGAAADRPDGGARSQAPLALLLHALALLQGGRKAEGTKRLQQARLLPLGDGEVHYNL